MTDTLYSRFVNWEGSTIRRIPLLVLKESGAAEDEALKAHVSRTRELRLILKAAPNDPAAFLRCIIAARQKVFDLRRLGLDFPDVPPPTDGFEDLLCLLEVTES